MHLFACIITLLCTQIIATPPIEQPKGKPDQPQVCPTDFNVAQGITVFPTTVNGLNVQDIRIDDISGIAISRTQLYGTNPIVWVVQDGNQNPYIHGIEVGGGKRVLRVDISEAVVSNNRLDIEDLSIGPCDSGLNETISNAYGNDCLYLMDIGNGNARLNQPFGTQGRTNHFVYRIPEPIIDQGPEQLNKKIKLTRNEITVVRMKFNQHTGDALKDNIQKIDTEGGFVDPITGNLYFISKWEDRQDDYANVYEISKYVSNSGAEIPDEIVGRPMEGLDDRITRETWTRADISMDGKVILFGNANTVYFWLRDAVNKESIEDALRKPPCNEQPDKPPTGNTFEAVSFDVVGAALVQISRGSDRTLWYTSAVGMNGVTQPYVPGKPIDPGTPGSGPSNSGGIGGVTSKGFTIEPLPAGSSIAIAVSALVSVGLSLVIFEWYTGKGDNTAFDRMETRAVYGHSWRAAQDDNSGATYFYNKSTGEVSWHPPPGFQEL